MAIVYDILLDGTFVGQAEVSREGLYYHIVCRCRLAEQSLCKIQLTCGEQTETLGTLVPQGKEFVLIKKLPVKLFTDGIFSFRAIQKRKEMFVPICNDEPFPYISKLKTAHLEHRNGKAGIVLRDV